MASCACNRIPAPARWKLERNISAISNPQKLFYVRTHMQLCLDFTKYSSGHWWDWAWLGCHMSLLGKARMHGHKPLMHESQKTSHRATGDIHGNVRSARYCGSTSICACSSTACTVLCRPPLFCFLLHSDRLWRHMAQLRAALPVTHLLANIRQKYLVLQLLACVSDHELWHSPHAQSAQ